jgi:pyruvate dehydrogenase E1 component
MPAGAGEGILRGLYRIRGDGHGAVRLAGAGTILREALAAADLLQQDGIAADVYSVTSFTELRRCAREDDGAGRTSWIAQQLPATGTPIVAASDYVSSVADLIRPWVADRYIALGTDGYGRSDTRAALREFFGVDRKSIAQAARSALQRGS